MKSIQIIKRNQLKSLEVRAKAEEKYTRNIHREMEKTVWKQGGCNSWYQSKSGHVVAMYPGFSFTFRRLTTNFRKDHHLFNGNAMMSNICKAIFSNDNKLNRCGRVRKENIKVKLLIFLKIDF